MQPSISKNVRKFYLKFLGHVFNQTLSIYAHGNRRQDLAIRDCGRDCGSRDPYNKIYNGRL